MAYLALYRRFRPSGFDSLIGQEHVVRTLVNQINSDKIGHAYLFCGARGTGKTSAAKIFARAINCLSPINGSPCGKCEACRSLADPSNLDIVEMDAASNNKVENVREIRDKIQYPPVSGRYKVYIIDEVHMLTAEAFNALLKTLEEPPKHAVFILATTEVHKLPATILSRCMRFDFRLIPTGEIAALIGKIYKEIGKDYDEDAVNAIARAGAGSVRDALSVADICASYRDGKLEYNDVLEVLGATDGDKILSLLDAAFSSDAGELLAGVEGLADSGKSVGVLCKDVISALREVAVCKTCKNGKEILSLPDDEYRKLISLGEKVDERRLLRIIEIFTDAEGNLKYASSPRAVLETACVKAAMPSADYNIDALLSRIAALEEKLKNGFTPTEKPRIERLNKVEPDVAANEPATVASVAEPEDYGYPTPPPEEELPFDGGYGTGERVVKPAAKPVATPTEKAAPTVETQAAQTKETEPATPRANMSAGRIWGTVVRKLRADRNIVLWVACQDMTAALDGNTLVITAGDEPGYNAVIKEQNLQTLTAAVRSVGNYAVKVVLGKAEERDDFADGVERLKKNSGVKNVVIKE